MDRLEMIRMKVDRMIQDLASKSERKFAYIHLYGTSQFATMLAVRHHVDAVVAAVAAMLHDIASYAYNVGEAEHAKKSAEIAQKLLSESDMFSKEEIKLITHAILVIILKLKLPIKSVCAYIIYWKCLSLRNLRFQLIRYGSRQGFKIGIRKQLCINQ